MKFKDFLKKANKKGKEPDISYIFDKEQNIEVTYGKYKEIIKDLKMIHIIPDKKENRVLFTNKFLGHLFNNTFSNIKNIEEVIIDE